MKNIRGKLASYQILTISQQVLMIIKDRERSFLTSSMEGIEQDEEGRVIASRASFLESLAAGRRGV